MIAKKLPGKEKIIARKRRWRLLNQQRERLMDPTSNIYKLLVHKCHNILSE